MASADNRLERQPTITFSFGRNWKSYSRIVSEEALGVAQKDIADWLGPDGVRGKSIVDVGCGSGIHSLCFYRMGARSLRSIDVDPHSVDCTRQFWQRAGKPQNWHVDHCSVLDAAALAALGSFDVVYSWGVLHHTGQMWAAIDNVSRLAKPQNSRLWISIYAKGPSYALQLKLKQRFNRSSWPVKQALVVRELLRNWRVQRRMGKTFRQWFWRARGMNAYHDAIDWLGGLPYEVATVEEINAFLAERGWTLERVREGEACIVYLFTR
jgi:2-polyprenyl-6-hydroxyphenyl methylase/3-demethylubiquinone-9 3-methyltransferase